LGLFARALIGKLAKIGKVATIGKVAEMAISSGSS
jgi:hypothetical protein